MKRRSKPWLAGRWTSRFGVAAAGAAGCLRPRQRRLAHAAAPSPPLGKFHCVEFVQRWSSLEGAVGGLVCLGIGNSIQKLFVSRK